MMVSFFVLFYFPRGVLDEILNLIESVSGGFPSYFSSAGASYNFDYSRARAYCACSRCGWGLFGHFYSISPFSSLSPSLWETARYRLKYCLKGPLNPKQPTNPYSTGIFDQRPKKCEVGLLFYCDSSNVEVSSKKFDVSVCLDGKELTMLTILNI